MRHYYQDIEGWFDFERVYEFAVRGYSGRFLELGSYKGKSSAFLAVEIENSGKHIELICCDTFKNEDCPTMQDRPGNNLPVFMSHMGKFPFMTAAVGYSENVAPTYPDGYFDFIFIGFLKCCYLLKDW